MEEMEEEVDEGELGDGDAANKEDGQDKSSPQADGETKIENTPADADKIQQAPSVAPEDGANAS